MKEQIKKMIRLEGRMKLVPDAREGERLDEKCKRIFLTLDPDNALASEEEPDYAFVQYLEVYFNKQYLICDNDLYEILDYKQILNESFIIKDDNDVLKFELEYYPDSENLGSALTKLLSENV